MADTPPLPTSPSGGDPRLEIPEVLRQPIKKPDALLEYDKRDGAASGSSVSDSTRQATGWVIAMTFVYTLAAAGLLGWAIQTWAWPRAAPWPLLVGLILGLVLGMGRFIRDAMKANKGV